MHITTQIKPLCNSSYKTDLLHARIFIKVLNCHIADKTLFTYTSVQHLLKANVFSFNVH
jgi:hypothetical protein